MISVVIIIKTTWLLHMVLQKNCQSWLQKEMTANKLRSNVDFFCEMKLLYCSKSENSIEIITAENYPDLKRIYIIYNKTYYQDSADNDFKPANKKNLQKLSYFEVFVFWWCLCCPIQNLMQL